MRTIITLSASSVIYLRMYGPLIHSNVIESWSQMKKTVRYCNERVRNLLVRNIGTLMMRPFAVTVRSLSWHFNMYITSTVMSLMFCYLNAAFYFVESCINCSAIWTVIIMHLFTAAICILLKSHGFVVSLTILAMKSRSHADYVICHAF